MPFTQHIPHARRQQIRLVRVVVEKFAHRASPLLQYKRRVKPSSHTDSKVLALHRQRQAKTKSRSWREFAEPDVAVADGMVVVLEGERELVWTCGVRRADVMPGGAGEFDVVLREDAVVEDGDMRGASEFAGCVKARAM